MNDDELLGSYLDGELAAGDAHALEQRLATDSALKARLDALRGADAATRRLFAAVDAAPMPDSVLQLLAKAKNAETAPQRSNVLAFPARGLRQFWQTPVAIAASVALAVGFMASQLVQQAAGPDTGLGTLGARSIDAGSGLYALLEDQASGQVARLGDAVSGQAVLTFTDQAGRYCRQLRLDAAAASAHAVACRAADAWQIEALAYTEAVQEGQFQTAAGATPAGISAAVDGLIGDQDPLDLEEENQVISRGWVKTQ